MDKPVLLLNVINVSHLLGKYKQELNEMIIMDDYDGGQAAQLRRVISDLEHAVNTKKPPLSQEEVGLDY